jgi:hypothetical protein
MLLCISYQFSIRLGIIAWYQLNKEYIATVLCENKDKPEMKCCGKCYLNKQLKKTEDNSSSKQAPVKTEKVEFSPFIPVAFIAPSITAIFADGLVHHEHYNNTHSDSPLASIFHPPSAVAALAG